MTSSSDSSWQRSSSPTRGPSTTGRERLSELAWWAAAGGACGTAAVATVAARGAAARPPQHTAFDPDQIDRALWNLLDNAVRHSPQDGVVTLGVSADARGACIAVSDQGPGVPADERSRIFERFYRVDRTRTPEPHAGTGLGLAIVRSIAHAHDGDVTVVDSAHGATFELRIG
jgi:signal transduction histidine kinase